MLTFPVFQPIQTTFRTGNNSFASTGLVIDAEMFKNLNKTGLMQPKFGNFHFAFMNGKPDLAPVINLKITNHQALSSPVIKLETPFTVFSDECSTPALLMLVDLALTSNKGDTLVFFDENSQSGILATDISVTFGVTPDNEIVPSYIELKTMHAVEIKAKEDCESLRRKINLLRTATKPQPKTRFSPISATGFSGKILNRYFVKDNGLNNLEAVLLDDTPYERAFEQESVIMLYDHYKKCFLHLLKYGRSLIGVKVYGIHGDFDSKSPTLPEFGYEVVDITDLCKPPVILDQEQALCFQAKEI